MKKLILLICLLLCKEIAAAQSASTLKNYRLTALYQDYDLMVNALKEAHPGLYWYTSRADYEKIFSSNRAALNEGMNTYDFYRIASKILAADLEGHSSLAASKDIGDFVSTNGRYLPFAVKTIDKKLFLLNDIGQYPTRGKIISHINKIPIDTIIAKIFAHSSRYSDGFSKTGKYRDMDNFGFGGLYMDIIDYLSPSALLTVASPDNSDIRELSVNLISRDSLIKLSKTIPRPSKKHEDELFALDIDAGKKSCVLTLNTFDYSRFKKQHRDFKKTIDSLFAQIRTRNIRNIIIDVREVGGGNEGAEDYLFSYLTKRPYQKYDYVEANAFSFTFLDSAIYKAQREDLEQMLTEEHETGKDGRILRKKGLFPTVKPQKNPFKGKVYILCSGKTYSGGSEFVSIAKAYSKATIVGEETGGGFYGQTSGSYVHLTLPNTQLRIRIPLLKFATTFRHDSIPFGRGVIPDYQVSPSYHDYTNNVDRELEFTHQLINKN